MLSTCLCNLRDDLFVFTNTGRLFKIKAYEINEGSRIAKGKKINSYLDLPEDEKVVIIKPVSEKSLSSYLFLATKKGIIKKSKLSEYQNIRKNGLVALRLEKDDELIGAQITTGNDDIISITKKVWLFDLKRKKLDHYHECLWVKGMRVSEDDEIKSLINVGKEQEKNAFILVVSENGLVKTSLKEYRRQRGGRGIKTVRITQKTGWLVKLIWSLRRNSHNYFS